MGGAGALNVYMNAGNGDASYASNSGHQKKGILKSWHLLEESLESMSMDPGFPKCFRMADLGCSSGPNTLLVISRVIEKVREVCRDECVPEFEVFLNDLPYNDFNNIFNMLPDFYQNLNMGQGTRRCFVSGLPGSFYGRLFSTNTLNFVYSSYSLQWLSQVPEGLERNKDKIHMAMTSPPEVFEAYARQYKTDFTTFLKSRGEEMVSGGRMVLILVGRSSQDPSLNDECAHFTVLANTLVDMIDEGLVKRAKLHSFNMPIYTPCRQEVETLIQSEGSFNLEKIEGFQVPWDAHVQDEYRNRYEQVEEEAHRRGQIVSNFIRAYTEPIVANHFGGDIVDDLYKRYGKKLGNYLSDKDPMFFNMTVCLSKKANKQTACRLD